MPKVLRRVTLPTAALLLVLAACEGGAPSGSGTGSTENGSGSETGSAGPATTTGTTTAALDSCPTGVPTGTGDLESYLRSARISSGFTAPGAGDLIRFTHGVEALLRNPADAAGREELVQSGFEVSCFTHRNGTPWLVIADGDTRRGGGTFAINLSPSRELIIEAPHGDSDQGTHEQSVDAALTSGAHALLINGASRCAADAVTSCSGTGSPCGKLRISDAAHDPDAFFTAMHRALRLVYPGHLAISVHGMTPSQGEAAVLSDGTSVPRAQSISKGLRDALNRQLTTSAKAYSCNDPADDGKFRKLCGTSNIQGRIDNGSGDACTTNSTQANDRFLHLEQGPELRLRQPELLGKALTDAIPCTLGNCATASR